MALCQGTASHNLHDTSSKLIPVTQEEQQGNEPHHHVVKVVGGGLLQQPLGGEEREALQSTRLLHPQGLGTACADSAASSEEGAALLRATIATETNTENNGIVNVLKISFSDL